MTVESNAKLPVSRFDMIVIVAIIIMVIVIGFALFIGTEPEAGLRIAYLKTNDDYIVNIWLYDLATGDHEQITNDDDAVFDYNVSPDGDLIAFTQRNPDTEISEIMVLDLETRRYTQVTNCADEDSACTSPAWRPDGQMLAYQRISLNTGLGIPVSPNRIWLLDLSTNPSQTFPLIPDPQVLGYGPEWSGDGQKLAFYDSATGGILVYNFEANDSNSIPQLTFLPTTYGNVGKFSPDGTRMLFPELLAGGAFVHSTLEVADLETLQVNNLTNEDDSSDDPTGNWSPDGTQIAFTRRYLDEDRRTIGHQIYMLNVADLSTTPLIVDRRYNHSVPIWSPDGTQLLVQRFQQLTDEGNYNQAGTLEIWTYTLDTGELVRITEDAYNPQWVP